MIHIRRKPTELIAELQQRAGAIETKNGIMYYKAGDYLVTAPTGCTWAMTIEHMRKFYEFLMTDL